MSNYPAGCTTDDIDRSVESSEPYDSVRFSCGHWDREDMGEFLGEREVCGDCAQRARNIALLFEGCELSFIVDAVKFAGPARMGNHTLFASLLKKLEDAAKVKV